MLNVGKDLASMLQTLEASESTYQRGRNQPGGMKSKEAKRLKQLEDENKRLKQLVADLSLVNKILKYISEGTVPGTLLFSVVFEVGSLGLHYACVY
ncbi:hypothetical protein [Gimesia maris]|uniref:hypothetical protein n=1 Tax=Gimesia maris TaxID=122 RepID=UPI0030DD3C0B|tara:strand:- start:1187 stop:1474 length:288 start_codon:yes stop_codon:yes gene_type:complete